MLDSLSIGIVYQYLTSTDLKLVLLANKSKGCQDLLDDNMVDFLANPSLKKIWTVYNCFDLFSSVNIMTSSYYICKISQRDYDVWGDFFRKKTYSNCNPRFCPRFLNNFFSLSPTEMVLIISSINRYYKKYLTNFRDFMDFSFQYKHFFINFCIQQNLPILCQYLVKYVRPYDISYKAKLRKLLKASTPLDENKKALYLLFFNRCNSAQRKEYRKSDHKLNINNWS